MARSAQLWKHVQPSGLSDLYVEINVNASPFRGDSGECFETCTDQTSAMSDTKAVAR